MALWSSGVLAIVFAVAAISKLKNTSGFRSTIASLSPHLGKHSRILVFATIGAEAILTVLVSVPETRLVGLGSSVVLLLTFSVFLNRAVKLGVSAPCRCFGQSATPINRTHVVRSGALATVAGLGGAATGIIMVRGQNPSHPPYQRVVIAVILGIPVVLASLAWDDLVEVFKPNGSTKSAGR